MVQTEVKILWHFLLYFIMVSSCSGINFIGLNPTFQMSKIFCFQQGNSTSNGAYFQNKFTNNVYFTQDGKNIVLKPIFPSVIYKKMVCTKNKNVLILTISNSIIQYSSAQNTISTLNSSEVIIDIECLETSQNEYKIVYLTALNELIIKNTILSANQVHNLSGISSQFQIQKIKCSKFQDKSFDGYCFMNNASKQSLIYFNYKNIGSIMIRESPQFLSFTISQSNERLYLALYSGQVKQYCLKNSKLFYSKQLDKYQNKNISIKSMQENQFTNQLLLYTNTTKLITISLQSQLLSSSQVISQQYVTLLYSFTSPNLFPLSNNTIVFSDYNDGLSIQQLNSTQNILILNQSNYFNKICQMNNYWYNQSKVKCVRCQQGCAQCDQQTAQCLKCIDQHFFKNGSCLSCKEASISSELYDQCFQQNQIKILQISNAITPVLTATIRYTYSILSSSALLFLFLRFINFWSIVSVYYFLNIEAIPYFLLEFLQKIFVILYGSVFTLFNIDISRINMGIKQKQTNFKIKKAQISTDFLQSNFQSIITFTYSVLLICLLYDKIKAWFRKFNICIFQKVKLQACLQQFLGIFIPFLIPLNYFIFNLASSCLIDKINNALFMLSFGMGVVFPFIYIILIAKRITLKKRLDMLNQQIQHNQKKDNSQQKNQKPLRNQEKKNVQSIAKYSNQLSKKSNKLNFWNKINFLNQEEGQKFLYCLTSFWVSFLAGIQQPQYFLFTILLINILSVWNSIYAKHWRINLIVEKSILLIYHSCFIGIYLFPAYYFNLSIVASLFIIIGGIHELFAITAEKIYFLYLILKQKKISNINKIADLKVKGSQSITFSEEKQHLQKQQDKQQTFQKSSLKNIKIGSKTQKFTRKTQKSIKKTKKFTLISQNYLISKAIVDLKTKTNLDLNDKESFQQVDLIKNNLFNKSTSTVKVKFQQTANLKGTKNQIYQLKHFKQIRPDKQTVQINYNITKSEKGPESQYQTKVLEQNILSEYSGSQKMEKSKSQNKVKLFRRRQLKSTQQIKGISQKKRQQKQSHDFEFSQKSHNSEQNSSKWKNKNFKVHF